MNDVWESLKNEKKLTRHYYGDVVRFLFMFAAVLMVVTLPFLANNLPVSIFVSIFIILAIGILAGITNPLQKWTSLLNAAISTISLFAFEYYAAGYYMNAKFSNLFFVINQVLAIVFLFALYYSIKTLRAMYLKGKQEK